MENSMTLHQNKELFSELLIQTAQMVGLPEVYIEKDYWVTYVLKHLSKSPYIDRAIFKGGTSLSKAYKFDYLNGLSTDHSDNIYVADTWNDRI